MRHSLIWHESDIQYVVLLQFIIMAHYMPHYIIWYNFTYFHIYVLNVAMKEITNYLLWQCSSIFEFVTATRIIALRISSNIPPHRSLHNLHIIYSQSAQSTYNLHTTTSSTCYYSPHTPTHTYTHLHTHIKSLNTLVSCMRNTTLIINRALPVIMSCVNLEQMC